MKKIGNLYGCDIFLDTEDQARADLAIQWMEDREKRLRRIEELELKVEIERFKRGR